jgi:hypothetical protein
MVYKGNRKAQSAMEYLMTYGWAILIIAIVLVALFALGIFNSGSFTNTTCIATSGFECTSVSLTASGLTATVGQATGATWTTANVFFLGPGVTSPPSTVNSVAESSISGGLTTGQTATITIGNYISTSAGGVTAMPSTVGQTLSGQLWVAYTTSSGGSTLYTEVATANLKVT